MGTFTETQESMAPMAPSNGDGGRSQAANRRVAGMDEERLARGLGWFSIGLGVAELLAPQAISRLVGTRNHSSLIRAYGLRELAAGVGILSSQQPAGWVWSRVAGDMLDLAALGGVLASPENDRGMTAFGVASVAAVTTLDILCAQALSRNGSAGHSRRAEASLTVGRSPEECYSFWRNFENLPRFMSYLDSVRTISDRKSHWKARVAGQTFEWDAEIESDSPNERISWHSSPSAEVDNAGSVEFERAPAGRGTIVRVQMEYGNMPQGVAAAAAALLGKDPEQMIHKELRRFKQVMETGEVIETEGQPAGRRSGATWLDQIAR